MSFIKLIYQGGIMCIPGLKKMCWISVSVLISILLCSTGFAQTDSNDKQYEYSYDSKSDAERNAAAQDISRKESMRYTPSPMTSTSLDKKPSGSAMLLDIFVYRPLGFIATGIGTGAFIIASPFSAMGGNFKESFDAMVVTPAKFTFKRPIGHMEK